jgi:hypothetical protein
MGKALGMTVLVAERKGATEVREGRVAFDETIKKGTVFIIVAPGDDSTRGMFNKAEFEAMDSSALIINVGRGGVVNEKEVAAALREGTVGGYGTDVFEREPATMETCPLLDPSVPNLVYTPHLVLTICYVIQAHMLTIIVGLVLRKNYPRHNQRRPRKHRSLRSRQAAKPCLREAQPTFGPAMLYPLRYACSSRAAARERLMQLPQACASRKYRRHAWCVTWSTISDDRGADRIAWWRQWTRYKTVGVAGRIGTGRVLTSALSYPDTGLVADHRRIEQTAEVNAKAKAQVPLSQPRRRRQGHAYIYVSSALLFAPNVTTS